MEKKELMDLLASTKERTLGYFDLTDDDHQKNYGVGKWSIRQILHHLTDSELVFHERLKRIIAGPKQVIWAYDQDLWNAAFDYKNEPLNNKKKLYAICRELNHELTEKYYSSAGNKEFVHNETGLGILINEFERVATHNLNHNQQIQTALSK